MNHIDKRRDRLVEKASEKTKEMVFTIEEEVKVDYFLSEMKALPPDFLRMWHNHASSIARLLDEAYFDLQRGGDGLEALVSIALANKGVQDYIETSLTEQGETPSGKLN